MGWEPTTEYQCVPITYTWGGGVAVRVCHRMMAPDPHLQLTGVTAHETGDSIRCNSHQSPHHESSNSFPGPDCFHPLAGEAEAIFEWNTQGRKIIFNVLNTHWTKANGNFSGHSNCIHSNSRNRLLHTNHRMIYHTFTQYGTFTSDQFPVTTDSFGNCTLQKAILWLSSSLSKIQISLGVRHKQWYKSMKRNTLSKNVLISYCRTPI